MQDTDATRRPPFFCPYTNRDPDQKKRILSCPWGACVACRAGVARALHHGVPRQWLSHGMPASLCATLASLRVLPCLAVPSSRSVVAVSCRCCPAWQDGQPCPRGALSAPGWRWGGMSPMTHAQSALFATYRSPQAFRAEMTGSSVRPSSVSRYSTRGGTSG